MTIPLEIINLSKSYDLKEAVRNISFEVNENEGNTEHKEDGDKEDGDENKREHKEDGEERENGENKEDETGQEEL